MSILNINFNIYTDCYYINIKIKMKLDINEVKDSNIIRIQKNLIMMDFDIEMINKILLYFNIESEDQAIDYLTKNSEGLWQHPFIEKITF